MEIQNLFAQRIGGKEFGINNEVYKFALIKKWKQEAEKIYGELSGDHDDSFFYSLHPFQG